MNLNSVEIAKKRSNREKNKQEKKKMKMFIFDRPQSSIRRTQPTDNEFIPFPCHHSTSIRNRNRICKLYFTTINKNRKSMVSIIFCVLRKKQRKAEENLREYCRCRQAIISEYVCAFTGKRRTFNLATDFRVCTSRRNYRYFEQKTYRFISNTPKHH